MTDDAAGYRWKVEELAWALVGKVQRGIDLIGLGEVISVLQAMDENPDYETAISVGIEIGFEVHDADLREDLFYGLRVSENGIEFDRTDTFYSREVGSDHHCANVGFLGWEGRVCGEPDDWFRDVEQALQRDDCVVSISRDHE